MVFVKVRETYDLHTTKDKMTVIAIHTPKFPIVRRNFPGLLLQCKAWRPFSCDVKIASASVLPLDPLGVGTGSGDVAPEDVFNPILYKAMSNRGMSQLEARINYMVHNPNSTADVRGNQADVDTNNFSTYADEFDVYYGLLADTNSWKHAHPQQGLEMNGLKPLVWDVLLNIGDTNNFNFASGPVAPAPQADGTAAQIGTRAIIGAPHPLPMIPTGIYNKTNATKMGFYSDDVWNSFQTTPDFNVVVGAVIIPPSRLHELFFRMVVEWTLEFSAIRSAVEIVDFPGGINSIGSVTHFQNYSYESTKEALTGDKESILENDACMVSSNAEVKQVM